MKSKHELANRLEKIQQKMLNLIAEAKEDMRKTLGSKDINYQRAECYWIAHIECALESKLGELFKRENYPLNVNPYDTTMEGTIKDLTEDIAEEAQKGNHNDCE